MPKQKNNLGILILIGVIMIVVLQSGFVKWNQPTQVNLAFAPSGATISECSTSPYPGPECSTPTSTTGSVHVADTNQVWTLYYLDGTIERRSSAIFGLGLRFSLVDLSQIRAIQIQVPIILTTELQCQNFNPIIPSCLNYQFVVVRPAATVSLNGESLAVLTQNWWAAATFMYGRDHAGATVSYDFYVLLSGQMESSNSQTLDLRSQVKNLGVSQFNFNAVISEDWSAYVSRISSPVLTDRKIVPVAYGADFNVNLNQFSGTFTVPLPTQTVRTCTSGICVDIPATTFTTIGPGITATVTGSGTTFTLATTITDTWKPTNPFDVCGWIPWLCGSTFGIPNWALLALGVVLLLLLFTRKGAGQTVTIKRS